MRRSPAVIMWRYEQLPIRLKEHIKSALMKMTDNNIGTVNLDEVDTYLINSEDKSALDTFSQDLHLGSTIYKGYDYRVIVVGILK